MINGQDSDDQCVRAMAILCPIQRDKPANLTTLILR